MFQYQTEDLLITTKTYPSPSQKYIETSCVAAINKEGKLIRLFPIPFRLIDDPLQFKRWEWIRASIKRASNDARPESYNIDVDSIVRLHKLGTDNDWAERLQWITPHIAPDFQTLELNHQNDGRSLGFISPLNFSLEIVKSDKPEWTPEEKSKLNREYLFETKSRTELRKVPFDFYYHYQFLDNPDAQTFKHKITDWEVGMLYWNCVKSHGPNWQTPFKQKLENEFKNRQLIFQMGTMHRFPDQWLIVGLVYPPKVSARQLLLWNQSPNV